jgi:hypothetical protein
MVFDELSMYDDGDGDGGGHHAVATISEKLLDYESFLGALKKISRQSSSAIEVGQYMKKFMTEEQLQDELAIRWEGFRQFIGGSLNAAPRSDEDKILMNYIYSTPILHVSITLHRKHGPMCMYTCMHACICVYV